MTGKYNKTTLNNVQKIVACGGDLVSRPVHVMKVIEWDEKNCFWLHDDERLALSKKKRKSARLQFLSSRFLAKFIVLGPQQERWHQHAFIYDNHLNCIVTKDEKLAISHSGEFVALVQLDAGFVGLDIQYHSKGIASIKQMSQLFAADDWQACSITAERFYQLWVLKEAFAKLNHLSILDALPIALSSMQKDIYFHVCEPLADLSIGLASLKSENYCLQYWSFVGDVLHRSQFSG